MIYCFDLDGTICDTPNGKKYADAVIKKFKPTENTLVVDIGSNDGIFLTANNANNKGHT